MTTARANRSAEEPVQLDDDDIEIVSEPISRGAPRKPRESRPTSRTLPKVLPPPKLVPPPRSSQKRVVLHSDVGLEAQTRVSNLGRQLARLEDPKAVPRLAGDTATNALPPACKLLLAFMESQMPIGSILDASPLPRDATLHALAQLVTTGTVTLE